MCIFLLLHHWIVVHTSVQSHFFCLMSKNYVLGNKCTMLINFTTTALKKKRKQKSTHFAMKQYGSFATAISNNYLALIVLFLIILHYLYSQ